MSEAEITRKHDCKLIIGSCPTLLEYRGIYAVIPLFGIWVGQFDINMWHWLTEFTITSPRSARITEVWSLNYIPIKLPQIRCLWIIHNHCNYMLHTLLAKVNACGIHYMLPSRLNPITLSVRCLVRNYPNCAHAVYIQSGVWQRQSDQFTNKFALHSRVTTLWLHEITQ